MNNEKQKGTAETEKERQDSKQNWGGSGSTKSSDAPGNEGGGTVGK